MSKLKIEDVGKRQINQYLKDYPKTSGLSLDILNNWNLTDKELARKFKRPEGVISRFRKLTVRWMSGKRNKKKVVHVVKCKSAGKAEVRNEIMRLISTSKSPKSGIVPTLPFEFEFEKQVIKNEKLSGLHFWGYEFAYNVQNGVACKKRYRQQLKTLENNPKLASRITMFYKDMNEVLQNSKDFEYAHIFADYCGTLRSNGDTIASILRNKNLKIGGILWVTLNSRSGYGERNSKTKLLKLIKEAGKTNFKIELFNGEKVFKYQGSDSGQGSPMYAVAIRRVK